jgi:hypothetical protein
LVSPGTYTATLFSTANGETRELTEAVSFNVKPLHEETEEGGLSPQQRSSMIIEVAELRRSLSAATSQIADLKALIKSFRIALDRSSAVASDLEVQYEELRRAVFNLDEIINGKRSSIRFGAVPATISSRLSVIELAGVNTWGLTSTQKQQMVYVKDALGELQPQLDNLFKTEFPAFKKALLDVGAPWVPSGGIEASADDRMETD